MDNFSTIDIQRLAVTPQYEDNTYIGLDSNGKLIRTNIDKAGGSDIDLSGYATEKWVKNQDYSTNSDVDEKVRQVNHKFYNYYTKEQVDDKIADIDIEISECVKENEIATINGISLTNGGNIIIQGGEGGTVDLTGYYTKEEIDNKGFLTEHQDISGKQDKIDDLDSIRSGAALGATALQNIPSEYVTENELDKKLENIEVDLSDYYTKDEVNDIVGDTNFKTIDGESIVGEGDIKIFTNENFVKYLSIIEGDIVENRMIIDDIKDKQWGLKSGEEVISGNYGTTTIGNLKTVHGISLLGEGDINIFYDTGHIEWMKWVEDMIAEFKNEISKLKEK